VTPHGVRQLGIAFKTQSVAHHPPIAQGEQRAQWLRVFHHARITRLGMAELAIFDCEFNR
jgi:hypothetical protein